MATPVTEPCREYDEDAGKCGEKSMAADSRASFTVSHENLHHEMQPEQARMAAANGPDSREGTKLPIR